MLDGYSLRNAEPSDVAKIVELQQISYRREFWEPRETYAALIQAYPIGSNLAIFSKDIVGYLFAHPITRGARQELGTTSLQLTGNEDCMYLHDIAVHPIHRGKGLPNLLLDAIDDLTRKEGLAFQALVSVQKSRQLAEKKGFSVVREITYGGLPAVYMEKRL